MVIKYVYTLLILYIYVLFNHILNYIFLHTKRVFFLGVSFSVYENIGVIKSAGVEIRDVRSTLVPVRKELQQGFDLESYSFVPFIVDEVC